MPGIRPWDAGNRPIGERGPRIGMSRRSRPCRQVAPIGPGFAHGLGSNAPSASPRTWRDGRGAKGPGDGRRRRRGGRERSWLSMFDARKEGGATEDCRDIGQAGYGMSRTSSSAGAPSWSAHGTATADPHAGEGAPLGRSGWRIPRDRCRSGASPAGGIGGRTEVEARPRLEAGAGECDGWRHRARVLHRWAGSGADASAVSGRRHAATLCTATGFGHVKSGAGP